MMQEKPSVFAMDRRSWDHPCFTKEPFTEWQAWAWLISEAAWKDHRRRSGKFIIDLKRGQVPHSVRFMAEKWQWSKSKTHRFIKRLKNETLIGTDSGTGITIITICKYDRYQIAGLPSGTANETPSGTEAGQKRDKLETRETGKEDKRDTNVSPKKNDEIQNAFDMWNDFARREGLPIARKLNGTRKALINARLKDLEEYGGWQWFCDKIRAGPHLLGQNNRNWRADLPWVLKEANFLKIIEGNYDNRKASGNGQDRNGSGKRVEGDRVRRARELLEKFHSDFQPGN